MNKKSYAYTEPVEIDYTRYLQEEVEEYSDKAAEELKEIVQIYAQTGGYYVNGWYES